MKLYQYHPDCLVIGDGRKYILIEEQYIPFVSCSRTDRLREGDKCSVIIEIDNDDKSVDLSWARDDLEPVWKWPLINGIRTKQV